MKKLIIIFLIFISSSCGDCIGDRYQVHEKNDLGNGQCEYVMWALTECATWQSREVFKFNENCNKFKLSEVLSKDAVAAYR